MDLKVVFHYSKEDKDFSGDYYDIEVFHHSELIPVISYGDNGRAKLQGFIDGVRWLGKTPVNVIRKNVADRD